VQGKLSVDAEFETLEAVKGIKKLHDSDVKPYDTLQFEVNGELKGIVVQAMRATICQDVIGRVVMKSSHHLRNAIRSSMHPCIHPTRMCSQEAVLHRHLVW
jgi:hypothetical protein